MKGVIFILVYVTSVRIFVNTTTFSVLEEEPINTFVGQLVGITAKSVTLLNHVNAFYVNKTSWIIYTKKIFDRETLAESGDKKGFKLIFAIDSKTDVVYVQIKDKNDNVPYFQNSVSNLYIREDVPLNYSIKIDEAIDKDVGTNAITIYRIVSGDKFKNLVLHKNRQGLFLQIISSLDREQTDNIILTISACDEASGRCTDGLVNITVTDVNDNKPKFSKGIYAADVYENATIGTIILFVHASDADEGLNAKIKYTVESQHSIFTVSPQTGAVILQGSLDYELRRHYKINVVANDANPPMYKTTAIVEITVFECNDNSPDISFTYRIIGLYNIMENEKIGTKVGTVVVSDKDADAKNNQVTLTLLDTNNTFKLEKDLTKNDAYGLYVNKMIDREKTPRFVLKLLAVDNGTPPLHTEREVILNVGDINDNIPIFSQAEYKVSVYESKPIGSLVLTVTATDLDIGSNRMLTYKVMNDSSNGFFVVNKTTGSIYLKKQLDRENTNKTIYLNISAMDHGTPVMIGHTSVIVNILDVNDNDPYFNPRVMYFNITENNDKDLIIGKVTAHDRDSEPSRIVYRLNDTSFRIGSSTGVITALRTFDREQKAYYHVLVTAVDSGGRRGTGLAIICILDVNDYAPKFEQTFYNLSIHEDFPVGNVAWVVATDEDEGDNAKLVYNATFKEDVFKVDANTGAIMLQKSLKNRRQRKYRFNVRVQDIHGLRGQNVAQVLINVLPANNKPPVFAHNTYYLSVNENNIQHQTIGTVVAKRLVSSSNAFIEYHIINGNHDREFNISNTGVISANMVLDFEKRRSYTIFIQAVDLLDRSLTANATVVISIEDENDNSPFFVSAKKWIDVEEGLPIGYVIYRCMAYDRDSGDNSRITYSMYNTTGPFSINNLTGEVNTTGSLDYESVQSYSMILQASDRGNPVRTSYIELEVKVLDVNDNPPVFEKTSYKIHIKEDLSVGTPILKINATDADSGKNGTFHFLLLPSSDAKSFFCDKNGVLSLKEAVDRERKDAYEIGLVVEDEGLPSQRSETTLKILIVDVNDEFPKFGKSSYAFELREERPPGTEVGEVMAGDADIGDNGKLSYSLINGNGLFNIATKKGTMKEQSICVITSAKSFDSETDQKRYTITVVATDHGSPPHKNQVFVQIDIKNVNDHMPKFSQSLPYLACVVEGTAAGSQISKISARDLDAVESSLEYTLVALLPEDNEGLALFRINPMSGHIHTKSTILSTHKRMYEVSVSAMEVGTDKPMFNYQKLIVFVVSRRQKTFFNDDCVQIPVRESFLPIQGAISKQFLYDSSYVTHSYKIEASTNQNQLFHILENTGLITLKSSLDHQVNPFYQLKVSAEASKNGKLYKDYIIINVLVIPSNIDSPSYPNNPEFFTIREDFKPAIFSTLKLATDNDSGMEGIFMYSIAEASPADAPIKITPIKREIIFTKSIDREKIDQFVLKVRITDLGLDEGSRQSQTFTLYLMVEDVNDNKPIFVSSNQSKVMEDARFDTLVTTIKAEDPDKGKTNTAIVYEILSGNENSTFNLDYRNGHLRTRKKLNIYQHQRYNIVILAKEYRNPVAIKEIPSLNSTVTIIVDIVDVNDKVPRFTNEYFIGHVRENMPPGSFVIQLNATDDDIYPEYKNLRFELLVGFELFHIDALTGVITTKTTHDRENVASFILKASVSNIPSNGEGKCSITVQIDDENDHAPTFKSRNSISLRLFENSRPALLHQFRAMDNDIGSNADVIYKISRFHGDDAFFLDKKTGKLSVLKTLDRETINRYEFRVEAQNTSPPRGRAHQNVTIVVDDMNDEKPVFQQKLYVAHKRENKIMNMSVVQVKAVDKDLGTNSNILYSLLGDGDGHFGVNPDNGDVFLMKELDYEETDTYHLKVKATGAGINFSDIADVTIYVTDENDNSPVFSRAVYSVTVLNIVKTTVIKVTATDADEKGRQKVVYYFDPPSRQFSIDRSSGAIQIIDTNLMQGQYRLHVRAQDEAYRHKTYAPVFVSIGNPNKTILTFLNNSVVFSLQENPKPNTRLGYVLAVSTLRSPISYHIVDGSNPSHAFGITNTGELYVNNSAAVDYEQHPGFFLGVLATTSFGNRSVSSFLNVLINLTDINDNYPIILPKYQRFSYPETNEKYLHPTIVHTFYIADEDQLDRDKLRLDIVSGNDNKVFAVSRYHQLLLMKNVDYEQQRQYQLVVRVTDTSNHWNDSRIDIDVDDQNDNPPVFPKLKPIHVSEAAPKNSIIANITATDIDTVTTEIKYGLECVLCRSTMFAIDNQLGTITLTSSLDYETEKQHTLNISAFDGIHKSYITVIIKVDDANDNTPQFTQAEYSVKVSNLLKKNTYIIQVKATDKDSELHGPIRYKFDPPKDAFTIEQETGVIFTNKDVDLTPEKSTFKLGVVAYDCYGRNGSRSTTATVKLTISGTKTIVPVFEQSVYYFSISEGASVDSHVDVVLATISSGVYKGIKYSIVSGNDGDAFNIGLYKGDIKVNSELDREKKKRYTLKVIAEGNDLNKLGTCFVKITIEDANDNSPYFFKSSYNVSVKENVKIGMSLIQLIAHDDDDANTDNARIRYEIHSGQDEINWLRIDPTTGWVKTARELDRETTSQIKLTIKAADMKGLGRKTFASLNVTILDVNDETPQFKVQVQIPLQIKENLKAGSMAMKVKAVDKDAGSNGLVNYRIINGTGLKQFYMKDDTSGWVYTTQPLDYEKVKLYSLSVLATDNGQPQRSASFEYQVFVEDVNEYIPQFTKSAYTFKMLSTEKPGSEIGRVNATDQDGGTAGVIRYSIVPADIEEFSVNRTNGIITVVKDLRLTSKTKRKRRSVDNEPFQFSVIADNGLKTNKSCAEISVAVNFTCPGCARIVADDVGTPESKTISNLVIVASVSLFVLIFFLLCVVVYCRRKRTCIQQSNQSPFCKTKKESIGPSSSVERELLQSNASSYDPLQPHFFTDFNNKAATQISSDTGGLVQESAGTVRSVSATDKASTYSFGIYHEQAIPESEIRPFSDTLSNMSLKDLEQDSVFAYSSTKIKRKPTRSCVSRSTQQSSLYSLNSSQAMASFNHPSTQKQTKLSARSCSHESLKDFREEGGGEAAGGIDVGNLLYVKLAEVDADEQDAIMDGVRPFQEEGVLSHGGSLSTIIGSEDDLRVNYDYKYMNNWRPQFNPVNSVFSEIGRTNKIGAHDTSKQTGRNKLDSHYTLSRETNMPDRPDEIPLQVLKSGRTSMLSSVPSLPRTPQEIPSAYTSGALSPNFTPALTPLVFRSPSVSSVGTQENYGPHSPGPTGFQIGLNNPLRRTDSMKSQLSRITLSDISVSDDEV